MTAVSAPSAPDDLHLTSPSGLRCRLTRHGSLRQLAWHDLNINLFAANTLEGGTDTLVLRRLGRDAGWVPLLGPRSPSQIRRTPLGMVAQGRWGALRYTLQLLLSAQAPAWFWHLDLDNDGDQACEVDLLHAQDLALAPWAALRTNEYYVSHYLDHTPLAHPRHGTVLATRQNLAVDGRHPWLLSGSLRRSVAWATDGLQWHGLGTRADAALQAATLGLPGHRLQHEHALAALQDEPLTLPARAHAQLGFYGLLVADHPEASGPADLRWVEQALALPEATCPPPVPDDAPARPREAASLFATAPRLSVPPLDDADLAAWFGPLREQPEHDIDGRLLSFFQGSRHVVLRAKELQVLRPHGHLLRTGTHLTPDETALTSTCWMGGVFHSMVTQGHVGINRFLGTVRGYLGQFRSQGLRVFVELDGQWQLLDQPAAFAMEPDRAHWYYPHAGGLIEVCALASSDPHRLELAIHVRRGAPLRCLFSLQVALDGDDGLDAGPPRWQREGQAVRVRPAPESTLGQRFPHGAFRLDATAGLQLDEVGGDGLLYPDGRSRGEAWLCLRSAPLTEGRLDVVGELVDEAAPERPPGAMPPAVAASPWQALTPPADPEGAAQLRQLASILPWFQHNALVHYLAPRGLEQFSGGGWGTRDVCQGPVELLLALGRPAPIRDLLCRVFGAQGRSGDWPQWFMFFERERTLRAGDSHGDIVYWPLLALGQYLLATGDGALLDQPLPYFEPGAAEPLWQHAQRALRLADERTIAGTALAAYGHGDWNDALQPADPALRERLCSSWTVTLHHQVLTTLARALRAVGRDSATADALDAQAQRVHDDFHRLLMVDGEIAGYALFQPEGTVQPLLHPQDRATGVHHSLLPMMHALLNDLLSPEQARHHVALIRRHLSGPDGARLFDRPMDYRGGPQTWFQRAESSSYFGREIGLMYTHAHLRWAEALAHLGEAEAFAQALGLAHPVGLHERSPSSARRQANCYYSSSDAAFADRYEAARHYCRIGQGAVTLEGGWRIYSSGAGIGLSLVMRHLLGLRSEADAMVLDPVMPASMDGLALDVTQGDQRLALSYQVGPRGHGVSRIVLNGVELPFTRRAHRYRLGAAVVARDDWQAALARSDRTAPARLALTLGQH